MKKRKTKNFFTLLWVAWGLLLSFGMVYASDIVSINVHHQEASASWSNNSLISIPSTWGTGGTVDYWNAWNNSTIIGNYFKGYYYDSMFWFFELDWLDGWEENVEIVGSTNKCDSGYGYKLWGYAYSAYFGFMDFDYSDDIFVYYCVDDNMLHGYSYSTTLWFQNFEWIGFDILPNVSTLADNTSTWIFVNDTTKINLPNFWDGNIKSYLAWDAINLDDDKESIFYIIK
jgi:hypothetical protein